MEQNQGKKVEKLYQKAQLRGVKTGQALLEVVREVAHLWAKTHWLINLNCWSTTPTQIKLVGSHLQTGEFQTLLLLLSLLSPTDWLWQTWQQPSSCAVDGQATRAEHWKKWSPLPNNHPTRRHIFRYRGYIIHLSWQRSKTVLGFCNAEPRDPLLHCSCYLETRVAVQLLGRGGEKKAQDLVIGPNSPQIFCEAGCIHSQGLQPVRPKSKPGWMKALFTLYEGFG